MTTLFAESYLGDLPRRDHWLYQVVDRTLENPGGKVIEIPEGLVRFFDEAVLEQHAVQPWLAALQGELRQKYARLLATQLPRRRPPEPRAGRDLAILAEDFYGALGLVEGLLSNPQGYDAARAVQFLEQVRLRMPADASKRQQARYFELRAYLRQGRGDARGAIEDLETATALWPVKENGAVAPLQDHYVETSDAASLDALQARLKRQSR